MVVAYFLFSIYACSLGEQQIVGRKGDEGSLPQGVLVRNVGIQLHSFAQSKLGISSTART